MSLTRFSSFIEILVLSAMLSGLPSLSAAAQPVDTDAVSVTLTQAKVVKPGAESEPLLATDALRPGDVIEYRVTYRNNSPQPVSDVVAELPIPMGFEYLALSAKPHDDPKRGRIVEVAAQDGRFGPEPLLRPGGKPEPVPYSEYRTLRWSLGALASGAEKAVTARATVSAP